MLDEFLEIEEANKNQLGDSGGKLSGGQIQRITIARALFRKSKILIMDEATSSLDLKTRDKILSNIKENFQNLTMIIISHDEKVFSICDKIYKLDDGKVELV